MRSKVSLVALCESQNWRCAYCGVKFFATIACRSRLGARPWSSDWTAPTRDHVIPRKVSGPDHWKNIIAACRRCNELRQAEPAQQFMNRRGWIACVRDRAADRLGVLSREIRETEPQVDVMRALSYRASQSWAGGKRKAA